MNTDRLLCGGIQFALLVLVLLLPVHGGVIDSMRVVAIPPVEPLEFDKGKVTAKVNFVFDTIASDCFVFYNKEQKSLVVEFFGVSLNDSLPGIKGTDILRNLRVENSSTDLAFNKKIGRLVMDLDSGWHYESLAGDRVLRVTLWAVLDPAKKIKPQHRFVKYLFVGAGFALATVLVFFFAYDR